MATNHYFNPYPANITSEQNLIEDILVEAIQINGMDVFYMPRTTRDVVDLLYGEDTLKTYTNAYPLEMYLENVFNMEGEGDIISKFGLEIRDEVSLLVARRRFKSTVPNMIRPREGDIIYIPLVQNFFEITFVEHENDQAMMYTLGRGRGSNVFVYALKLKQYVFSNEVIETGNLEIDQQVRDEYPKNRLTISSISGKFNEDEVVYQGDSYNEATAEALVYEYQTVDDHVTVYRTQGVFKSGELKSTSSSNTAIITIADDTAEMNDAFEDIVDNMRIQTEADEIIDFSVSNPFGTP